MKMSILQDDNNTMITQYNDSNSLHSWKYCQNSRDSPILEHQVYLGLIT